MAEVDGEEMQNIRFETDGLTVKQVSLIAAKIGQLPTVEGLHWCRFLVSSEYCFSAGKDEK